MWTKKQLVQQALEEIGYAAYIYDLMPEQLESVLQSLDAMMATWQGRGIRIGYATSGSPSTSDIDAMSGVPDKANEAIYTNLAIRIAPRFGKTITPETKQAAKIGYDALLIIAAQPIEMQFPDTLPVGAGNKPWRNNNRPFVDPPTDYLQAGVDNNIDGLATGGNFNLNN